MLNTLCGQNTVSGNGKACGTCSYHYALNGWRLLCDETGGETGTYLHMDMTVSRVPPKNAEHFIHKIINVLRDVPSVCCHFMER